MGWKQKNLRMQFSDVLAVRFQNGLSASRHEDKQTGADALKIYSAKTYENYKRTARHFADWMKIKHPDVLTIADAFAFVNEYLQERIEAGFSASTIKAEVAAFSKIYEKTAADFIQTPRRCRAEVVRSRNTVKYDRHFSEENNSALVSFCRSTGLRRNELEHLRGDFLVEKDGQFFLDYTDTTDKRGNRANYCKGGRPRLVPVIGDVDLVVKMCRNSGSSLVFPKVHHAADIHRYRADYAVAYYEKAFAEKYPDGQIPRNDRYVCRNDQYGKVLSRSCMAQASQALGHSRISVIAESYLYPLDV